jgi:hypothetical protein
VPKERSPLIRQHPVKSNKRDAHARTHLPRVGMSCERQASVWRSHWSPAVPDGAAHNEVWARPRCGPIEDFVLGWCTPPWSAVRIPIDDALLLEWSIGSLACTSAFSLVSSIPVP